MKQFFAARTGRAAGGSRHMPSPEMPEPSFVPVGKGPIVASAEETARNPRARSAKLRAAERTDAPAQKPLEALTMLADLPRTADKRGGRR